MTNKTPAQEALEDYKVRKASGFNLEGMGAWVWQNEQEIVRSLNILKAIESGEWKCVPVEPTREMIDGTETICTGFSGEFGDYNEYDAPYFAEELYKAMLSKSPEIGEEK